VTSTFAQKLGFKIKTS